MKTDWTHLEGWRVTSGPYRTDTGQDYGQFLILLESGVALCVIATSGADGDNPVEVEAGQWEHVSVHARQPSIRPPFTETQRTPTWDEMCAVKALFWEPGECVIQYHPPAEDYVNTHAHVLHLWRPKHKDIPLPPRICV